MRVCVASSGLGHVARGIEAWASDLGSALADRGVDVLLCKGAGVAKEKYERVVSCWTRESQRTQRLLAHLPRRLFWRLGLGSSYDLEQTTFAVRLLQLLRKEGVDILHVQDPQVALVAQRAHRWGWIHTRTILAHGTEESIEFQKSIAYLQHLAPWHLEEARQAGAWRPTWTAIPNFVDTERFRPGPIPSLREELGIPREAFVVLSAAAIKRSHKRVDHVVGEVARLRKSAPHLPLWLVVAGGWDPETDSVVAEGQALLGDRVRFLVRFPRERMADLYRASDVFVLASLKEMMPIAVLEASACGLTSLVNRHPVMEWMIGPGGRAIDMSAPGALAGELEALLCDESVRQEQGGTARAYCVDHFGRSAVVDQIEDYYRYVLDHDPHAVQTEASGPQAAT